MQHPFDRHLAAAREIAFRVQATAPAPQDDFVAHIMAAQALAFESTSLLLNGFPDVQLRDATAQAAGQLIASYAKTFADGKDNEDIIFAVVIDHLLARIKNDLHRLATGEITQNVQVVGAFPHSGTA